jgi:integrase
MVWGVTNSPIKRRINMATPQWLEDRIKVFIPKLAPLTDEIQIRDLCLKEVQTLRVELDLGSVEDESGVVQKFKGKPASLHSYLSEYRNRIKNEIPCTSENSYETVIGKFATKNNPGSRRKVRLHFAQKYLKKSTDEVAFRNQSIQESSDIKRRNPRYFYSDEVIAKALELIKSECFSHVTLGLILLTGRRPSEILKTADFKVINVQTVMFTGQLKTRDCPTAKTLPFPIPVLADSKIVCDALTRLREMSQVKPLADKSVKACNSKAGVLSEACDRHFGKLIKDCTPHELRAAYAQICLAYRRPDRAKRTDYEPYFAEILGHAEDDLDTSKKYKKFELLD